MTPQEKQTLENLIDTYSISTVFDELQCICREKADHIEQSYSDKQLAIQWRKLAQKIVKTFLMRIEP